MDFYTSGFWYTLGYARIGGGIIILLASMAWEYTSNIWNLIPGCLMWIVWLERNRRSFEDTKKTLKELKVLCQHSLFEWSRYWGFTFCSSL